MSKDNLRGPKRFILGLYAPGKRTNSTQLVIRLTPIPAADPNAGAAGASSLRTSRPLTLDEAEPFGVYFFQSSMLRVLTREGIRPKKKSQPGRSSLLKVQPTDNPGPVGSSQLRDFSNNLGKPGSGFSLRTFHSSVELSLVDYGSPLGNSFMRDLGFPPPHWLLPLLLLPHSLNYRTYSL